MDLFHRNKNICDQCGQKFEEYDELISHAIHVHHHPIGSGGKQFIHDKDRLHHVREEHEKKIDHRTHKWEHAHNQRINPQEQIDQQTKNFGDNF